MKDKIYSRPADPLVKFTFDKQVADVFPDMIVRSVPGYETAVAIIGVLAGQYTRENSNCYDLGSSLGAVTLSMRKHIKTNARIIAVDNSQAMIEKSQKIIERNNSIIPVELICADIRDIEIVNASIVVLNFTLQFIGLNDRDKLIDKIFLGLNPGGIVVLSEKVCFDDPEQQERLTRWHHAYKKANGYSELEVAQKRTALENVLVPETQEEHIRRFKNTGFKNITLWFQCLPFISLLAEK